MEGSRIVNLATIIEVWYHLIVKIQLDAEKPIVDMAFLSEMPALALFVLLITAAAVIGRLTFIVTCYVT
ncbi:Uncharacterised protein [Yersinia intermedia]|uniref:Uncharacterized protein n=1 Tax=Yersinia intermedia TaxID=631 RepID=A0A0T9MY11_YERIN|nr:hypothetical protein CH53_2532 [Yersinia intermedia]ARB86394.1 hypothetical protein A6J67_22195 [Yersinia sp. FDAARGOS_228]AVL36250.1 hypothetical protein CEQ36_11895 [Yersinia intermedia]CNG59550.1 Uncharacterised protein [Yersinia intermedia]CNI69081.1 Uncharacterised protein [Yersinia intermedia]